MTLCDAFWVGFSAMQFNKQLAISLLIYNIMLLLDRTAQKYFLKKIERTRSFEGYMCVHI